MLTILCFAALALSFASAQFPPVQTPVPPTPPANFSLEFKLVYCSNTEIIYKPNRTWSHIGMYSPNTPQKWNYAMPSLGEPYVRYEGNPRTSFFWADAPNPRGFLDTDIPAEAIGYQSDAEAGRVIFEGVEYPCQVKFGLPAWGTDCAGADYPYCAGYTRCHDRFLCKAREAFTPPLQKNGTTKCVDSWHSTPSCYPYWGKTG